MPGNENSLPQEAQEVLLQVLWIAVTKPFLNIPFEFEGNSRSFKYLSEEGLHCLPGPFVCFFIVCGTPGWIITSIGIGKAMDCTTINNNLPVHARLSHFFFDFNHLIVLHKGIIATVKDDTFSFNVFSISRIGGIEISMKADHSTPFRSTPG